MKEEILEKLLDISRKMAENRLLDPLLDYAIKVALELFDAELGYLVLVRADGTLDFRVRQDREGATIAEPPRPTLIFSTSIGGRRTQAVVAHQPGTG